MTSRPVPPENKAPSDTSRFALSLLVFCCVPALASSGINVDCDGAHAKLHDPASPVATLTVELVDHGMTKADIDLSGIVDAGSDTSLAARTIDLAHRAPTIAPHKSKNDSSLFQTTVLKSSANLIQSSNPEDASLASTESTPAAVEQENGNRTKSVTTNNAKTAIVEAQLPGVSDADLLRFRRQMYRTDI